MSHPAKPTRVNNNAVWGAGRAIRKSDAISLVAPAPPKECENYPITSKYGSVDLNSDQRALPKGWN